MRWRSRPLAVLALALLALASVEMAEAAGHAHAPIDGCAPCRVLSLCGTLELPSAPMLPGPRFVEYDLLVTDAAETYRPLAPSRGRAPPAR